MAHTNSMEGLRTYKCRAEARRDIDEFIEYVKGDIDLEFKLDTSVYGDQVEIDTDMSYVELTMYMEDADEAIGDLHVMVQSLKPIEHYDGERNNIYVLPPCATALDRIRVLEAKIEALTKMRSTQ